MWIESTEGLRAGPVVPTCKQERQGWYAKLSCQGMYASGGYRNLSVSDGLAAVQSNLQLVVRVNGKDCMRGPFH